jgi:glyoxylase-like metal-dependent hydrolase (beta-lactamase superfamily II)
MKQSTDSKAIPMTSIHSGKTRTAAPGVHYYTNQIVNVVFIALPNWEWVLVDAGMPKSGDDIIKAAEELFGKNNPPLAVILTHGHFDHVGSIVDLVHKWKMPVYAHPFEFPYLKGREAYPEPDTSVEGGLLAKISSVYPHEPIDISEVLLPLPVNGIVPYLPGWKWIHVPGHTPGQVALFREEDKVLISADAITTVRADAMYNVLVQKEEVCGPPVYFTTDWKAAFKSFKSLAILIPQVMIPGHGTAMEGEELKQGLAHLLSNWKKLAVPDHGTWVD